MIKLKRLLKDIDFTANGKVIDIDVTDIAADSRLVRKGGLFVAVRGTKKDGHDFIKEALRRGASAVIYQKDVDCLKKAKAKAKVKDTRKALALLARNFYDNPSRRIKVIGITGTNGKTTVSYLLESIFKAAGFKTGIIGTLKYKIGDSILEANNTTPSPLVLQRLIRDMVEHSLDYCVMEVSSHALDQHRVDCIDFDIAVFTNITREHLDYHNSFANYLDCKLTLFERLKKKGLSVINRDDVNFIKLKGACDCEKMITFGIKKGADVYADNICVDIHGSGFILHAKGKKTPIRSPLIGVHNVYNMLAAASCALGKGMGPDTIKKGLEGVDPVPGRLQPLGGCDDIKVFVDYAHTDDALRNVLTALKGLKKKNLITIFGCGGNRDKAKRPRMGDVAVKLSDYVIITSDNPRDEDPDLIIKDITDGIKQGRSNFKVVADRREAIDEAILKAEEGDMVLIAGKGHERYQIIKDRRFPFDDAATARAALKRRARCLV